MPSWMICHFSSGDRSTRGFLLNRAFLRESQTNTSVTWALKRSCNQAALVPSSKVTVQTAAQAANKLENRFGFRFEDSFHHQLAGSIQNGRGDRCLVNIQPNILVIIYEGAPCCRR
jgi:hypothetical protein